MICQGASGVFTSQQYFDLLRALRAPLLPTAMAFVPYGFVLVQVQVHLSDGMGGRTTGGTVF